MATTKKTTKVLPEIKIEPEKTDKVYNMPTEVSNWIDSAMSRIQHLTSTVERQKEEIKNLKIANKAMERRVMGTSQE
jgi:predicted RNase H-like nuclease (RuvC/YqgF family)